MLSGKYFKTFFKKNFSNIKKKLHLHSPNGGIIAQSVEQRTENPCVAGSIPADTTLSKPLRKLRGFFYALNVPF
jgi:hypothetical protein